APELYQLGEKLIDLEDAFRKWRFAHLATVSRVIGANTGTGGSTGLRYLRAAANQLFEQPMYPELWDVRNEMFSRPQEFDLAAAGYGAEQAPSPQPSPRTRGEGGAREAGG
ncbi:MAG: tryptophan 2,3-dioxygenase family protein, partial [Stellaceae bacterium]